MCETTFEKLAQGLIEKLISQQNIKTDIHTSCRFYMPCHDDGHSTHNQIVWPLSFMTRGIVNMIIEVLDVYEYLLSLVKLSKYPDTKNYYLLQP